MDDRKLIHIASQGKGGVFKSGASALLGQYLADKGLPVKCFDTDPTNATLSRFAGLNVAHVDVTDGNQVDIRKFNAVANRMCAEEGPFVMDTGATIFLPFWDYVAQAQLIEFFRAQDRRVIIHCPIMGGQELTETLKGFAAICRMVPERSVVVWLNCFHGAIEANGKAFQDFAVARENEDRIFGIVRLSDPVGSLRASALKSLSETNRTFAEALADPAVGLVERHLLHQVRRSLYRQLEAAGL
jgi:hypothetical protein